MTERKTTAKTPAAAAEADNAPIGRFYDLQRETETPKPYVLTEGITIQPPTRAQYRQLDKVEDQDEIDRVIFGENYEAINALYDTRPIEEWRAFMADFNRHFFGIGVEEAPGKSEESSSS